MTLLTTKSRSMKQFFRSRSHKQFGDLSIESRKIQCTCLVVVIHIIDVNLVRNKTVYSSIIFDVASIYQRSIPIIVYVINVCATSYSGDHVAFTTVYYSVDSFKMPETQKDRAARCHPIFLYGPSRSRTYKPTSYEPGALPLSYRPPHSNNIPFRPVVVKRSRTHIFLNRTYNRNL